MYSKRFLRLFGPVCNVKLLSDKLKVWSPQTFQACVRIIFGNLKIPWLVRSPDKALCDFYLCGTYLAEIRTQES